MLSMMQEDVIGSNAIFLETYAWQWLNNRNIQNNNILCVWRQLIAYKTIKDLSLS